MGYRSDPDLEFLGEMKSSELDDLVHCLTCDTDGKLRRTEELTNSGPYKEYAPDHHRYWQLIAAELQRFGANTFTTFFVRWGEGILYREVLTDVCDRLEVSYQNDAPVANIERDLLTKVVGDMLWSIPPEKRNDLSRLLKVKDFAAKDRASLAREVSAFFRSSGSASYVFTLAILNGVTKGVGGKALARIAPLLAGRLAALVVPATWIFGAVWTAYDIAGTAFRVTVPATILVAALRLKKASNDPPSVPEPNPGPVPPPVPEPDPNPDPDPDPDPDPPPPPAPPPSPT